MGEDENKMGSTMNTSMDSQAQVFATKSTYLYYTRYYDMLNKMDQIRRSTTLANIKSGRGPAAVSPKARQWLHVLWPRKHGAGRGRHCRHGLRTAAAQVRHTLHGTVMRVCLCI